MVSFANTKFRWPFWSKRFFWPRHICQVNKIVRSCFDYIICIFGHTTSFWDWDHDVLHLPYLPGIFTSGISDPGDFSLASLCRSDACPAAKEEGDPSLDRSNWKVRHGQISNGFIIWIFDHSQCETAVQWYFEQNKFLKLAWYIALHRSLQRSRDFMLAEDGSSICFSQISVVKSTRQFKRIQKASVPLCMMEACIVQLAGWLTSPHTFRIP